MKKKKYKVLFVSSEMAPFAKTGGLADVTASLAGNLRQRGHDVRVVMPLYSCVRSTVAVFETLLESVCVSMGSGEEWCALRKVSDANGVPVVFVEHEDFFGRQGLYHDAAMNDFPDNPRRFAFLCRAALQYCFDCGFAPDIVHAHDWQAALVPAYTKVWFWNNPIVGPAASVLTIHNIAYQGVYPSSHYSYIGLGAENFTVEKFEAFGAVNFLKGGIFFSDMVATVSPGHAREITTPYQGFGLAPCLSNKGERFTGILNGVDYSLWSPENDVTLPANYSGKDLAGKAVCKAALQKVFGLEPARDVCIVASIGRFVHQKGFDLLRDTIEEVLDEMAVQFVILGEGDNSLERFFSSLPLRYKGRAGSYIGHSAGRAHLVEAGADFFVMPSLFEPCGLNQLYSLRYGTLPIVRATGGLDDTVEQYDEMNGGGTGFKFHDPTAQALHDTIGWAVSTYYDRPAHIRKMIRRAMRKDFSWKKSVVAYERLYERAIEAKKLYDVTPLR